MCEECRFQVNDVCGCPNNVYNFGEKVELIHCDYMHHEIDENNMTNNDEDGLYD